MNFIDKLASMVSRDKMPEAGIMTRRIWMQNLALVSTTGAVMWACGSSKKDDAKATTATDDPVADGALLNIALGLEHEAISIYTQAAGLEIMKAAGAKAVLDTAVTFVGHHTEHRNALQAKIAAMKAANDKVAAAVAAKTDAEYLPAATAATLTSVKEVVRVAALKESAAAQAYLGIISKFTSAELAQTSGMLGGDEAAHYGVLRAVLFALLSDANVTAANVVAASLPSGWAGKDSAVGS